MNVIKTKIISLKLSKTSSKERLDVPLSGEGKVSYVRRFSVPYGQAVESWKKENSLSSCPEEEEYPIYQSASFKRWDNGYKSANNDINGRLINLVYIHNNVATEFGMASEKTRKVLLNYTYLADFYLETPNS